MSVFLCCAGVAQLVEQLICNQQVGGSSPFASSILIGMNCVGEALGGIGLVKSCCYLGIAV